MMLEDILEFAKTAKVNLHVTVDECSAIYASLMFCVKTFEKLEHPEAKKRAEECRQLADKLLDQM